MGRGPPTEQGAQRAPAVQLTKQKKGIEKAGRAGPLAASLACAALEETVGKFGRWAESFPLSPE
jgi:hypothetical protein